MVRPFAVLRITREVSLHYASVFRFLRENGFPIGANELWIGAAALANEMPLVTADVEQFRRVPHLEVVSYR